MHHCKIVIADDHPLFRAALKQAVSKVAKQVDIVEVSSMAELQMQHRSTMTQIWCFWI